MTDAMGGLRPALAGGPGGDGGGDGRLRRAARAVLVIVAAAAFNLGLLLVASYLINASQQGLAAHVEKHGKFPS